MRKQHLLHHVGLLEETFEKLLRTYENVYVLQNTSKNEWIDELNFIKENWEHTFTPDKNFNYKLRAFVNRLLEMSEKYTDGKRELISNTIQQNVNQYWRFVWGDEEWLVSPTRTLIQYSGYEIHPYYTDIISRKFGFLSELYDFGSQNYAKINNDTLLVYLDADGCEKYKLGNIIFSHGIVIGYDHNGIKDCPYTKESLKFLVKEI